MALKVGAYLFTGSVGLFSDAAESGVNLIAAVGAFLALRTAKRPPDEEQKERAWKDLNLRHPV
ncbi:MAG TPA: cation transporter [Rubrobacteraceae bacterium]